jgi:DNA mismatch repair protein MutS
MKNCWTAAATIFSQAVYFTDSVYGLAFLDISTGEFLTAEGDREYADKLLLGFKPAEVIFQRHYQKRFKEEFGSKYYTYTLDEWIWEKSYAEDLLLKQFNTHSLKGFGFHTLHNGLVAAGAVLHYLRETEHLNLQHITAIQQVQQQDALWMDRFTIRNLELLHSAAEGGDTLLKVIDHTATPMGARLLNAGWFFP